MIVADAGGLIALGSVDAVEPFVEELDVRTTPETVDSIQAVSARHGWTGDGARAVLGVRDRFGISRAGGEPILTSRLNASTGSCLPLARELDAQYLLSDAQRALHEIRRLLTGTPITPAIALAALVRLGALAGRDARFRYQTLVEQRRGLEGALEARAGAVFG